MARIVGGLIAAVLLAFGLLFLAAAAKANPGPRLVVGGVLVAMGAGVGWISWSKHPEVVRKVEVTNKIDLTGGVKLDVLNCPSCGAAIERDSIVMREGAVFAQCGHCKTEFQITEEPKW